MSNFTPGSISLGLRGRVQKIAEIDPNDAARLVLVRNGPIQWHDIRQNPRKYLLVPKLSQYGLRRMVLAEMLLEVTGLEWTQTVNQFGSSNYTPGPAAYESDSAPDSRCGLTNSHVFSPARIFSIHGERIIRPFMI